ncbi:MAG: aldo/keto reductase, partial [Bacteroidota bacterium]
YSLLDRRPEEACLGLLKQNNISVITRGSLAKGILAGKPAKAYLNYSKAEVDKITNLLQKVTRQSPTSAANVALQFVLNNEAITSAFCGIRNSQQLEDVLNTLKVAFIDKDNMDQLISTLPINHYEAHR